MGERIAQRLIFIYTNHVLHTKNYIKFHEFTELFLQPDEQEALVDQLQNGVTSESLPATRGGTANEDDEDDEGDGCTPGQRGGRRQKSRRRDGPSRAAREEELSPGPFDSSSQS